MHICVILTTAWLGVALHITHIHISLSAQSLIQLYNNYTSRRRRTEILFCFLLSDFFCDASLRARKEGLCSFFGEKAKKVKLLVREKRIVKLLSKREKNSEISGRIGKS